MLQIIDVCKEYRTGSLVQKALDHVSLNLRDNEFVAILGPSGSGKTTLLNIVGGLDRYDSGDLIINGTSTKKYKDRDWDSYRNHTIGFVFQSYNLIAHQTILSNVELALTISGVTRAQRRARAKEALEKVGLGDQVHKLPNQLSGGQMQRVAIARALVNDPEILLADEPTGALDSETSIQVMELLKEVAKDRLVVMVTHNPELAQTYATRIVRLKDGRITDDSDPLPDPEGGEAVHRNMGRASMSFLTALSLSFNNLLTKKTRTLLVAFAGSIGIIGIALILALSNGVDLYIKNIEEDTLSEYPVMITNSSFSFDPTAGRTSQEEWEERRQAEVYEAQMVERMISRVTSNDLASFKNYLEGPKSEIDRYAKSVEYGYQVVPQIYRLDESSSGYRQVHPDHSFDSLGFTGGSSIFSSYMNTDVFAALPENPDLYINQYEVMAGRWPENNHECIVIIFESGAISDLALYTLGMKDTAQLEEMIKNFSQGENTKMPEAAGTYKYTDFLGIEFRRVRAADYYVYDPEYQVWKNKTDDAAYMKELVRKGISMTVVGVAKHREDANVEMLSSGIYYPAGLINEVIEEAANSEIVKQQLEDPDTNVITGKAFDAPDDENHFDLSTIFSVNEDALQKVFSFDPDKLKIDTSEFSKMDFSDLDVSKYFDADSLAGEMPELTAEDLAKLLDGVEIKVSQEKMQPAMEAILADFEASLPEDDAAYDTSKVGESLQAYLSSDEAAAILQKYLEEAMENLPPADEENEEETRQLPQIDMAALAAELAAGYEAYAAEHEMADAVKINEAFRTFLESEEGKKSVREHMAETINADEIAGKLSENVSALMTSYTEVIMKSISSAMQSMMKDVSKKMERALKKTMEKTMAGMEDAFSVHPEAFAEAVEMKMDEKELQELMASMMSKTQTTYDSNLTGFGYADPEVPFSITIYPKDFDSKNAISEIITRYNELMTAAGEEEKVIVYTDIVGTMMASVTEIVDAISYVLIAFVAISLVVSSIMIGVITYISVLERKKEIGILRAIGASKRNISSVFNAETVITGLLAGVLGVGISALLIIPINQILAHLTGRSDVRAVLPLEAGVVLIILSIVLTLIGGLIPSRKAAKSDPVTALRTE
ncbi:MAG: ABC transporter ATP-binding protein/permease [Lachnospiraceae bacterium]|nr:ABC transporter ATP-binding protein/permease [Lachnospiraceae bacterium]